MKTYVDFGLDKDPKEEFKHDPLTPILEWFGSLKKANMLGIRLWFKMRAIIIIKVPRILY